MTQENQNQPVDTQTKEPEHKILDPKDYAITLLKAELYDTATAWKERFIKESGEAREYISNLESERAELLEEIERLKADLAYHTSTEKPAPSRYNQQDPFA